MASQSATMPSAPGYEVFHRRNRRSILLQLVLASAALVGIGFLIWSFVRTSPRQALSNMAPGDRKTLYDRTLQSTQELCRHTGDGADLRNRCRDSARFLLAFPECDAECRAFARPYAYQPTR